MFSTSHRPNGLRLMRIARQYIKAMFILTHLSFPHMLDFPDTNAMKSVLFIVFIFSMGVGK